MASSDRSVVRVDDVDRGAFTAERFDDLFDLRIGEGDVQRDLTLALGIVDELDRDDRCLCVQATIDPDPRNHPCSDRSAPDLADQEDPWSSRELHLRLQVERGHRVDAERMRYATSFVTFPISRAGQVGEIVEVRARRPSGLLDDPVSLQLRESRAHGCLVLEIGFVR